MGIEILIYPAKNELFDARFLMIYVIKLNDLRELLANEVGGV